MSDLQMSDLQKQHLARAKEVLGRAEMANHGQYSHGINSTSSTLQWYLKELESKSARVSVDECFKNIYALSFKLAGYLYALQNNL